MVFWAEAPTPYSPQNPALNQNMAEIPSERLGQSEKTPHESGSLRLGLSSKMHFLMF